MSGTDWSTADRPVQLVDCRPVPRVFFSLNLTQHFFSSSHGLRRGGGVGRGMAPALAFSAARWTWQGKQRLAAARDCHLPLHVWQVPGIDGLHVQVLARPDVPDSCTRPVAQMYHRGFWKAYGRAYIAEMMSQWYYKAYVDRMRLRYEKEAGVPLCGPSAFAHLPAPAVV